MHQLFVSLNSGLIYRLHKLNLNAKLFTLRRELNPQIWDLKDSRHDFF